MYKYILLVDQTNLLNLQFIEIKKRNAHEIEKSIVFFFFNQLLILINLNILFW